MQISQIVRDYCQDKGVVLPGSPWTLIMAQLSAENAGRTNDLIPPSGTVDVRLVPLHLITAGAQAHLKVVQPRQPSGDNGWDISGVVVGRGQRYRLVDGYHRFKWLLNQDQSWGVFIVLS